MGVSQRSDGGSAGKVVCDKIKIYIRREKQEILLRSLWRDAAAKNRQSTRNSAYGAPDGSRVLSSRLAHVPRSSTATVPAPARVRRKGLFSLATFSRELRSRTASIAVSERRAKEVPVGAILRRRTLLPDRDDTMFSTVLDRRAFDEGTGGRGTPIPSAVLAGASRAR